MPKTLLTPDETDIKLLRSAAKKIRSCAIPHVISEERWTGRSADQVKGIIYEDRHSYDAVRNLVQAYRWLNPKKNDILRRVTPKGIKKQSLLQQSLMRLRMARSSIAHIERNLPDAEVDGNLIHWMEHSVHIALWSPVVTESVAVFLEAEAEARSEGIVSSSSAAAVAMAKEIKKKKVWDNTIQTAAPKKTLIAEITSHIPSRRTEAVRRLKYMKEKGADHNIAYALFGTYGHLSPQHARTNVQRMLQRAEKATVNPKVKANDKRVWKARAKACQLFLESLDIR